VEGTIIEMKTDGRVESKVWEQVNNPLREIGVAISNSDPTFNSFSSRVKSIDADMGHAIEVVREAKANLR
jgi:hypothetical protein